MYGFVVRLAVAVFRYRTSRSPVHNTGFSRPGNAPNDGIALLYYTMLLWLFPLASG